MEHVLLRHFLLGFYCIIVTMAIVFCREFDASSCNDTLTDNIEYHQYSASSYTSDAHNASAGRIDGEGWIAGKRTIFEYLQIDLKAVTKITAIEIKDVESYCRTESFRITYSNDGLLWSSYNSLLSSDVLGEVFQRQETVTTFNLNPVLTTRFIVFNPVEYHCNPSLLVKLVGCNQKRESGDGVSTHINEDINTNTVWIPNQSPIVIEKRIEIRPLATLEIQAGVSVIFTTMDAGIDVYGMLLTIGVEDVLVTLSSNYPVLNMKGLWNGVHRKIGGNITLTHTTVRQASVGVQGDGLGIRLDHVLIYGCYSGIKISGGTESKSVNGQNASSPIVSNTKSMYNNYGIYLIGVQERPSIYIEKSDFSWNENHGFVIENWDKTDTAYTELKLYYCYLNGNKHAGLVSSDRLPISISLENSTFSRNGRYGIHLSTSFTNFPIQVNVSNSEVTLNGYSGVYLEYHCWTCSSNLSHLFDNNVIKGNYHQQVYLEYSSYFNNANLIIFLIISNNIIRDHKYHHEYPVYLRFGVRSDAFITNNILSNVRGGLKIKGNSKTPVNIIAENNTFDNVYGVEQSAILSMNSILSITKNTFKESSVPTVVYLQTDLRHTMSYNSFINNTQATCLLKIGEKFDKDQHITASYNFWGTDNVHLVKSKICDVFIDSTKGRVLTDMIYLTSEMTSPNDVRAADIFSRHYDPELGFTIIGGVIESDFVLSLTESEKVSVNRTIIVNKTSRFNISGGILIVQPKRGFILQGPLDIGNSTVTTTIRGETGKGKWNGIHVYSSDIQIAGSNLSDCIEVSVIKSAPSIINIESSTVTQTNRLIEAYSRGEDFTLLIQNSYVTTQTGLADLHINKKGNITIRITESKLSSETGYLFRITEQHVQVDQVHVMFECNDSAFKTVRNDMFKFELCSSNFNSALRRSSFIILGNVGSILKTISKVEKIEVLNNSFTGGSEAISLGGCIVADTNTSPQGELSILDNTFQKTKTVSIEINAPVYSMDIENNIFAQNAKCINISVISLRFYSIVISGNELSENNGNGIITLMQMNLGNSSIDLLRNAFINNTGTVVLINSANINIHHNVFDSAFAAYNVKVIPGILDNSGLVINASLNYWGTTDVKTIDKFIFDHDFDDTLFDVNYKPYLGSNNFSDIRNETAEFVHSSGEIGGNVDKDTVLRKAGSPYLAVSNIVIPEKTSLILEAGVEIFFKEDLGVVVHGVFISNGTSDAIVNLKAEDDTKRWKGIDIRSERGKSKKSVIRHTGIEKTTDGLRIKSCNTDLNNVNSTSSSGDGITILISGTEPENIYTELAASNNGRNGLMIISDQSVNRNVSFQIDGCYSDNNLNGIYVTAAVIVKFSQCQITGNKKHGVYVDQEYKGEIEFYLTLFSHNVHYAMKVIGNSRLVADSCIIEHHSYRLYSRYAWDRKSFIYMEKTIDADWEIQFTNNLFTNNTNYGMKIELQWNSKGDLKLNVENNTFKTSFSVLDVLSRHYTYYENMAYISFNNNTVVNNTMTERTMVVFDTDYVGDFKMINNRFTGNKASRMIIFSDNYAIRKLMNDIVFENNVFVDNYASSTLIDVENAFLLRIQNNIFTNNHPTACILTGPIFKNDRLEYAIMATYNYWGTGNCNEIIERVCGFEKDMTKSFIKYIPYYMDRHLSQLENSSHEDFAVDGAFGGEINSNITFDVQSKGNLTVISRSIFIRPGVRLTIIGAITLNFKKNRGIYIAGSLKINDANDVFEMSSFTAFDTIQESYWHGVLLRSNEFSSIHLLHMSNTEKGFVAYTSQFEIKRSRISSSKGSCITITPSSDGDITYDFSKTLIDSCKSHGILITESGSVIVRNVHINSVSTGIVMEEQQVNLQIFDSNITNSIKGVYTESGYYGGTLQVRRCSFANCSNGVDFRTHYVSDKNTVEINENNFSNITRDALHIELPSNEYNTNAYMGHANIGLNVFTNTCHLYLQTWNNASLSFHDNTIQNAFCRQPNQCLVDLLTETKSTHVGRYIDFSTNIFTNIDSECCVNVFTSDVIGELNGTFYYNQFLSTQSNLATIILESRHFNLSYNIFDNPETSLDIYVKRKAQDHVNASYNWWGSYNFSHAYNRIYDSHRDTSLLFVNITPVLTNNNIDCSGVNNCSDKGQCVRPNRCRCQSGWTGEMCTDYDCSDVNSCYGNGECIGPNVCNCSGGWAGKQCTRALCRDVNSCSGHGICVRPNVCVCGDRFIGDDCSSCVPLHWGKDCQPCPRCVNGQCNDKTGVCDCFGKQWTGELCNQCSETYYGQNCLPLMMVHSVIPNRGLDNGGNSVHVWGHNFPNSSDSYQCKFGKVIVRGEWLALNHVVCQAPQHPEGMVDLEISSDRKEFTQNNIQYQFYAKCPLSSCGRDESPPRGQCLFGGCTCNLPWTGSNCSIELLPPKIQFPSILTINETSIFVCQLKLLQGTNPVSWNVVDAPSGVTVDERTGYLQWQNVVARPSEYNIKLSATNIVGHHILDWKISVSKIYTVNLTHIEPSGVLPRPTDIKISGVVNTGHIAASQVPVYIRVTSLASGNVRTLSIETDKDNPTEFQTTYFPKPDDAGKFRVKAYHPGFEQENNNSLSWVVQAMRCEPSDVSWIDYIEGDTAFYKNVTVLVNTGKYPLQNVSGKVYGLQGVSVSLSSSDVNDSSMVMTFNEHQKINVNLLISNASPIKGTFYVVFRSQDKTSTRLQINVQLSIRKPVLLFSPQMISTNVARGKQKLIDVTITNIGDISAKNFKVNLPNDKRISMASFSTSSNIQYGDEKDGLSIHPNEAALLTVSYTIPAEAQLGELYGVIVVRTNLTVSKIPYTVAITSDDTLNLTIIVKDEYTYFANGAPLVVSAEVKLTNPRRDYFSTKVSHNGTGYVVFENIYEDRYTLYAKAKDHSSYSAVILASPENTIIEIFLQRTAVKYTWTVTPTTIQDKYKIKLDLTFETFVPMPVVTIDPSQLDTTTFELEEIDTVHFTITNHGLIRADNLRFSMPTGHPSLNFKSTVETIGDLAANTSIVVPVKITHKTRTKRSGGCGMSVLYSYECGDTRTNSAPVVLTGSCGGGNIYFNGHTSSGGWFRGGSIVYNSVTPAPCDCATELLKSCYLAYIPIVGCVVSVMNLAESSGPQLPAAVLDTAMSCVVGEICSVCGLYYTTLMCLKTLKDKCGHGKQKRDISSEVVENVLFTAKPLQNYIDMMEEIFADKRMFELRRDWHPAFKTVISDSSENTQYLSTDEMAFVASSLQHKSSEQVLIRFLNRWNNTVTAWDAGNLDKEVNVGNAINIAKIAVLTKQYIHDTNTAKQRGFDSIFSDFDHAMYAYRKAETEEQTKEQSKRDDAICAKVRVRIIQDLVLTREAFNARLEIENGETAYLENILVQIYIRAAEGTEDHANDKFSIGQPDLLGISGVDGYGRLGTDLSGSAEWLIVPYSDAAPYNDTQYLVGGRLSYRVRNSNFSLPLTPDIITVKPNPNLILHYFHEKYVQGDDPLTDEKEPVVPFSLAVMVSNTGNGITRALKITSAQPEIIENEKGLLVSFKIVGAFIGNSPMQPSLTVNFGDIASNETKTARWLLTSSLRGTFYNFSATFENINPLGDPQLSLFDFVRYHELIHLVRIFTDEDDGIDDFLVNDLVDNNGIPERLYNSANGSDIKLVNQGVVEGFSLNLVKKSDLTFPVIQINVRMNSSSWFYVRLKNNMTDLNLELLMADRSTGDNSHLIVGKNVWLTTHIQDSFLIHLLDYHDTGNGVREEVTISYNLTFGKRNTYSPQLDVSSCLTTIPTDVAVDTPICTVVSDDLDNNEVTYELIPESFMFNMDSKSGVIRTKITPLPTGSFQFIVKGTDDGIPQLSSYTNITVRVMSGGMTTSNAPTETEATSAQTTNTIFTKGSTDDILYNTSIESFTSFQTPMTSTRGDGKTDGDTISGSSANNSDNVLIVTVLSLFLRLHIIVILF